MNNPNSSTFRRLNYDEEEEDDLEGKLMNKTSRLKQITIQLGDQIRDSNKIVRGLDDDFDKSRGFLETAMGRIGKFSKYGNCKIYFSLIMFSFFVFFVLYLITKWF